MRNPRAGAVHSPYSDPGRHADLIRALPGTAADLSAAARNVIAHYRVELPDLPEERRHEVWDDWGTTTDAGDEAMVDRLADLLVRADGADSAAEEELYAWYGADGRLHPGDSVAQYSPYGNPPRSVSLRRASR